MHILFVSVSIACASFARSTVYKSLGSRNGAIEVGKGNLKLIYSQDEGKLTCYINSKSLVCYVVDTFFHSSLFI